MKQKRIKGLKLVQCKSVRDYLKKWKDKDTSYPDFVMSIISALNADEHNDNGKTVDDYLLLYIPKQKLNEFKSGLMELACTCAGGIH